MSVLCVGHANRSVSFLLFQCLYCVWAMLIGLFHFRYSVSVLCVGHANRSVFIFVISVSVLCVGHC